jgi:hypothetical protein
MTTHARRITATVALSLMMTAFAVHAQSNALKARIPFGFTAGSAVFSAGIYTIGRTDSSRDVLMIRTLKQGAMVMSQRGISSRTTGQPRFVFRRYGRQYFLREVWFADGGSSGYALPETREERQAAAEATKMALQQATVTVDAVAD